MTPLEEGVNELSVQMVNLQDEQRYMRARERAHRDSTCSPCCAVLRTFADLGVVWQPLRAPIHVCCGSRLWRRLCWWG